MRVAASVFFCTTAWLLWQFGVQGPSPAALVNVEIQEMMPAEAETPATRSSAADPQSPPQLLSFDSDRSAVLLALAAPVVDDRADFRLRLTREAEAGPETLWQDDSVRPVSGGGFTVLLRAESFPADGSYLLRLLRLDSDDEVMVAEYEIEVTLGNDS